MPAPRPLGMRLAARLVQNGQCIDWTGAVRDNGYGVIGGSIDGATYSKSTHRVAFELIHHGAIPDGLHMDHLCGNRACVNPDHLEPVTQAENNRRSGRWGERRGDVPADAMTLRDLVALLTGERPDGEV